MAADDGKCFGVKVEVCVCKAELAAVTSELGLRCCHTAGLCAALLVQRRGQKTKARSQHKSPDTSSGIITAQCPAIFAGSVANPCSGTAPRKASQEQVSSLERHPRSKTGGSEMHLLTA